MVNGDCQFWFVCFNVSSAAGQRFHFPSFKIHLDKTDRLVDLLVQGGCINRCGAANGYCRSRARVWVEM